MGFGSAYVQPPDHHRGQLTTLIKQLGYEPGITDIPWLPSLELPNLASSD